MKELQVLALLKAPSRKPLRLAALAAFALAAATARAQILAVPDRASLGANDTLDWASVGGQYSDFDSPLAATSTGGLGVTVTTELGTSPALIRLNQSSGWLGNFSPGDKLLVSVGGPMTFTLASPITGAGLNVQADAYGAFTAKIEAFAGGSSLGSFTVNGFSSNAADGSAPFLGFRSSSANVTSFTVSMTASLGDPNAFAVNAASFVTAVPEPSTYAAFAALGLVGFGIWRKIRN